LNDNIYVEEAAYLDSQTLKEHEDRITLAISTPRELRIGEYSWFKEQVDSKHSFVVPTDLSNEEFVHFRQTLNNKNFKLEFKCEWVEAEDDN